MAASAKNIVDSIGNKYLRQDIPAFRTGDTVKVHARIIEGNKERIQVFEGVVIKRNGGEGASATFTVRKVSFNTGVERTFYLHSPRVEKIEIVAKGVVRRARLFYLRDLRGKAARIKRQFHNQESANEIETAEIAEEVPTAEAVAEEKPKKAKGEKKAASKTVTKKASEEVVAPAAE